MTTSVSVESLNRAHIYLLRGQLTEALTLVEGLSEPDVPRHVFQQATALRMFLLSMIDPGAGRWEEEIGTRLLATHGTPRIVYLCIESDRLWNSGHLFQGLLLNRRALQNSRGVPALWQLYGMLLLASKLADMHTYHQAGRLLDGIRDFIHHAGLHALEGLADSLRSLLHLQAGRSEEALTTIAGTLRAAGLRESTIGVKSALSLAAAAHLSRGETDEARTCLDMFRAHGTSVDLTASVARATFAEIALLAVQDGPRAAATMLRARWESLGTESGCFMEDPTRAAWMVAIARRAGNNDLAARSLQAIHELARRNPDVPMLAKAEAMAHGVFHGRDPHLPMLLDPTGGERPPRRGRRPAQAPPEPMAAAEPGGPAAAGAARTEAAAAPFRSGPLRPLTSRQADIARLVAGGLTNHQIATQLGLSPHTVNFHLRCIFRKLSISSRAQLGHFVARFEDQLAPGSG